MTPISKGSSADLKLLPTTGSLKFWRSQDIVPLEFVIPIIRGEDRDQRSDWPGGSPPSWAEIKAELRASRSSYFTIKPFDDSTGYFVNILIGRYMLLARCIRGQGGRGNLRISLNSKKGLQFANNNQRKQMVLKGVRTEHRGIVLISFEDFISNYAKESNFYEYGEYAQQIIAIESRQPSETIKAHEYTNAEDESSIPLLETEEHLLRTLETYTDAEHFLEEQKARAIPGFDYTEVIPEKRASSVRKYYRLTLLESDYKRLKAQAPGVLAVEGGDDERPLQLQIDNLEPQGGKNQIVVSSAQQLFSGAIPETGRLVLFANPIQKNVRMQVIEKLQQRLLPNKWLLPLAAKSYQHRQTPLITVPISPSKYPPNPSQLNAINLGAGTEDYLLVLGPPGTGKTTVILRWVEFFVSQGKRILISSQNNKAVDNVLERLAENKKLTCVRLGNESAISSSVHNLLIDNCASTLQGKLVQSLEKNIAVLQEFDRMRNSVIEAARNDTDTLSVFITELSLLQGYMVENLKDMSRYITHSHSGADIFMATGPWGPLKTLPDIVSTLENTVSKHLELTRFFTDRRLHFAQQTGFLKPFYLIASWWYLWKIRNATARHKAFFVKADQFRQKKIAQLIEMGESLANVVTETLSWRNTITNHRQEGLYSILLKFVDVVGATCIGINTNKFFKDVPFDVAIIDESGQIQLHNIAVPLSRASKGILVGDHKQLPPVVNEELINEVNIRAEADSMDIDTELLQLSWFESLWDSAPDDRKAMLDTQFRCPAVISDYISAAFYEDKYFAGPGMAEKQPLFPFFKSPLVFIDTSKLPMDQRKEGSRQGPEREEITGNPLETKIVLYILERALAASPQLGERREIGVIVPYKLHVQEIQREISTRQRKGKLLLLPSPISELVASVDSYQGQERDLIVFTFTRSNLQGRIGFLKDWRRLNVAMTRAKKQLVMVGDFSTLTKQSSSGRGDDEFKMAMIRLREFVIKNGHLIDAKDWLSNLESTNMA